MRRMLQEKAHLEQRRSLQGIKVRGRVLCSFGARLLLANSHEQNCADEIVWKLSYRLNILISATCFYFFILNVRLFLCLFLSFLNTFLINTWSRRSGSANCIYYRKWYSSSYFRWKTRLLLGGIQYFCNVLFMGICGGYWSVGATEHIEVINF